MLKPTAVLTALILAGLLLCPALLAAQDDETVYFRNDLLIAGSYVTGSSISERSLYSELWSSGLLSLVTETGTFTHSVKEPVALTVGYSHFPLPFLGFQFKVDYLFRQVYASENVSRYVIAWDWNDGTSDSRTIDWPVDGDLNLYPFSLNMIFTLRKYFLSPYVSVGVTWMLGKIAAQTARGFGVTIVENSSQQIDFLPLVSKIDGKISSLGYNIAGGLDFQFAANVTLTAGVTYFKVPSQTYDWSIMPGVYLGYLNGELQFGVDEKLAAELSAGITPLTVNLGFFQFTAGLKVLF